MERGLPAREEPLYPSPQPEREERPPLPEEDELEVFQEEQPEDLILKRSDPLPMSPTPPADQNAWEKICEAVSPMIPVDLRLALQDEVRVCGRLEGKVLVIEAIPGFLYTRFNRQDVLGRFAEAAKAVIGTDVNVQLREKKSQEQEKRSLDELRQFKEVHFKD